MTPTFRPDDEARRNLTPHVQRSGSFLTPISQSGGFTFTYDSGLQTNNPGQFPYHGTSSTPTSISYNTGRYDNGRLDTWFRTTTVKVHRAVVRERDVWKPNTLVIVPQATFEIIFYAGAQKGS